MFETCYGENLARVGLKLLLTRCISTLEDYIKEQEPNPSDLDYVEKCVDKSFQTVAPLQRIVTELKEVRDCL